MLWLPNNDNSPKRTFVLPNLGSAYLDLKNQGMSDLEVYVRLLELIPHFLLTELGVKLKGAAHEKLFFVWKTHYRGLSHWVQLYLLSKVELLPELHSSLLIHIQPYAKLSGAYLEWSKQVHSKIEYAKHFRSHEELWYAIEASEFKAWVDRTGLTGFPAVGDDGRLLGKSEGIQHDMREMREWLEDIKPSKKQSPHPKKPREALKDFDYEPTLLEILLNQSEKLLDETDDVELQDACTQLIKARMAFKREISKGENAKYNKTYYLRSPVQLHISGDGKRTPRPNFEPKKPPGRPRKKGPKADGWKKT